MLETLHEGVDVQLKYKVPVGAPGDCKRCEKPITYQGEHEAFGPMWTHDHNRVVWCYPYSHRELPDVEDSNDIAEPKF